MRVKKTTVNLFRDVPKKLRKQMYQLDKRPNNRVMQLQEIQKPRTVTINGVQVPYTGP